MLSLKALQAAVGALSEHFHQHPLKVGSLLNFHFQLQRFMKPVDSLSDHALRCRARFAYTPCDASSLYGGSEFLLGRPAAAPTGEFRILKVLRLDTPCICCLDGSN